MGGRDGGSISAFDAMLAESRQQFDALLGDSALPKSQRPSASGRPAPPKVTPSEPARSVGRPEDATISPAVAKSLFDRFGHGWRHEILERSRQGDEITATCRLIVVGKDDVPPQTGSARFGGATMGAEPIAGSINGMPFQFDPAPAGGRERGPVSEEDALREAVGVALMKCLQTI